MMKRGVKKGRYIAKRMEGEEGRCGVGKNEGEGDEE